MELLRALPYDGFRHLENSLKGTRRVSLDTFTDAMAEACHLHGVDSSVFSRRAIQSLFHNVDFQDNKYVTWEDLTTHMIDDSTRVIAATHGTDSVGVATPSRSELLSLDHVLSHKQVPNARLRSVKYIESWDRMLRVVNHTTSQDSVIELTSQGSLENISKVSKPMVSNPTILEAITDHHLVVAAHQDMSCSVHGAQVLREGGTVTSMALHRILPMRETEESTTAMLWHPVNKVLYSGFRTGSIAPWNLRLDKNTFADRYTILARQSLFQHPISGLVPFEDKLVVSSIASHHNVALFDVTKQCVVETLKGHNLGVTAMTRVDGSDLIVTGGFERVPHLWILKIRDFPPWKLIDKAEPHRGNIQQVHAPPLSNKIISTDDRGMLKLWDIRTMRCVQSMFGDQPPLPKAGTGTAGQNAAVSANFFHQTSFHVSLQTMVSCGPQHVNHFRGNIPEFMDGTDDHPLAALLYHPTQQAIYTAHHRTVKVWSQSAGALLTQYTNVAPNLITAMTLDNRGRKFFLGTAQGDVVGCNIATGSMFRSFRPAAGELLAMTYATLRNGSRYVLAITAQDLLVYDDSDEYGRQQVLSSPLQHIRLQITKQFDDPEDAKQRADMVNYRGITSQSKLSLCIVWARWYVVVIDLNSLTVVHCFDIEGNDVVSVTTLGDLPAIAVLDHRNVLYIYAVRPCLSAGALLLKRDLNYVANDGDSYDKRTRNSIAMSRKQSLRRMGEENYVRTVVSEFVPMDATMPTGQHGCIMFYHRGKRVMYISDANGMLWEWAVGEFVKKSGLTSMHYPLQSLTDQILRRPCNVLSHAEGRKAVQLVKAYTAHTEEIKFMTVVFHNSRTRVVTGGQDNRVVAWDINGKSLGELSQGRFLRPELIVDKEALAALYQRYNVQPWTFADAVPDDDVNIMDDIPPNVLTMLRRAAARYRGRKGTFKWRQRDGASPLSSEASFEVGGEDGGLPEIVLPPMDGDAVPTSAPPEIAGRLHAVVMHSDGHEDDTPVLMTASANLSYNAFLKSYGLEDANESEGAFTSMNSKAPTTQPTPDDVGLKPLAAIPRAKFRVRGPLIKHDGEEPATALQRAPSNITSGRTAQMAVSPRAVRQTVTKRDDLPLTSIGTTSQRDATVEERERHVARSLRMDWDFYSRVVLKGARHAAQMQRQAAGEVPTDEQTTDSASNDLHTIFLGRSEHAKQMRCVYVPPIPPTKPPSRPSGTRQGRLPLTARDQEKFAVARLLGEADPRSGGDAPTVAMDDFHLLDRGSMRF